MTTAAPHDPSLDFGFRIPMGPFPARLRFDREHLLLDVVVGQVSGSYAAEQAWREAGGTLRGMFGPAVKNPGMTYDLTSGAVTITYAALRDADWDEVQSMSMAGVLYAAFMAKSLDESLTPQWRRALTEAQMLGPRMADPRRLLGTTTAPWADWDED